MRTLSTLVLLVGILCFSYQPADAQCARWKKNHNFWQLRMGIGLTPTFIKDHAQTEIPPLSLELRYRPNPKFSLGLLAGTSAATVVQEHHSGTRQTLQNSFRILALRAAVHTQRWEKWDTYGGIVLAYQNNQITEKKLEKATPNEPRVFFNPERSGFFYSAFLGTAYKPVPQIELFGELSYGLSILTLGAGFSW